jgi:predicted enzyme related to lactoylglutathione lyase
MDSVIHFEMPYQDRDRMKAFYESAFGWETQTLGPEMGDYVVVTTTESGPAGPKNPGAINGGFYPKPEDPSGQYPSVVIAVNDVHEAIQKLTAAGGTLISEPVEIPGIGQYAAFRDPEGNRASILQPLPRAAAE